MTFKGNFFVFLEQGCDSAYAFQVEGRPGYSGLVFVQSKDQLKVFNEDGTLFWEGVVAMDERGRFLYPNTTIYAPIFIKELKGELTRAGNER